MYKDNNGEHAKQVTADEDPGDDGLIEELENGMADDDEDLGDSLTYNDADIRRTIGMTKVEDAITDTRSQKRIVADKYDVRKYHKLTSPRSRA